MGIYADANEAVLRNIPSHSSILDIGCGSGVLGSRLRERGCIVYGIDISKESLHLAKKRLDKIILNDIEDGTPPIDKKFDILIFADVLEHLRYPEKVLKKYLICLKSKGKVIISLPNIANWTIRLKLLLGIFKYAETGILDKTHLHFYTLKSAKELLTNSGFEIIKIDVTPSFIRSCLGLIKLGANFIGIRGKTHEVHEQLLNSSIYTFYKRCLLPAETFVTRLWKNLLAYQFVLIAKKK